ncbi:MAG: SLC13 family permease [Peptococcaceae bacterium]|nr:SLC13 family permease [Peptococcaceae bacterium]
METTKKQSSVKYYLNIAMVFILMIVIGMLPPFGQITPLGMKVLGIFVGILYGWIFVDLIWPSVFGFFALALTGLITPLSGFQTAFSNATTTMVIMSFTFAYVLQKIGVNEAIAYWVLSKKTFVGRPWALIIAIVMASALMGILGGGFAAVFMLWGVVKTIQEINKIENGLVTSMLYALILFAGMTASSMVPFYGYAILFGGFLTAATGVVVEGIEFLFVGELYCVLAMLAIILIAKVVFKADVSKFNLSEEMRLEYAAYKLNKQQKVGLVAVTLYFLALLLPSVFKTTFFTMLGGWGLVGITVVFMTFFAIWRDEETGQPVCSMIDCFQKGVAWGPVLLFMITIPLANAMQAGEVGIMATINAYCTSIFGGLDLFVLYALIVILMGFFTQFMHNMVMGIIFIPVFANIVTSLGGNLMTFFFVIYCALLCSFATPAASTHATLVFAKDEVPTKHGYLFGWLFYIVTVVIVIALIPVCDILFARFM